MGRMLLISVMVNQLYHAVRLLSRVYAEKSAAIWMNGNGFQVTVS